MACDTLPKDRQDAALCLLAFGTAEVDEVIVVLRGLVRYWF